MNILSAFPRLTFLNLSNNLLRKPFDPSTSTNQHKYTMKKVPGQQKYIKRLEEYKYDELL